MSSNFVSRRYFEIFVVIRTSIVLAVTQVVALAAGVTVAAGVVPSSIFLQRHCVRCHGPDAQEGDVRLDDLSAATGFDSARWSVIGDQLRDGLMPPADEPRPDAEEVRNVLAWIAVQAQARPARLPHQGNLVPHEALFGSTAKAAVAAGPARIWRLSPDGYFGFVRDVHRGRADGLVQPFSMIPERGIKDYAELYVIDEPSTEILLRNAETIVAAQSAHEIVDGKVRSKNDTVREFMPLMDPATPPTPELLRAAIQAQFRLALGRNAEDGEVAKLVALYERCAAAGDRPGAARTMLAAVLLRADAMFRHELGAKAANGNRVPLTQHEIALALGQALTGRKERGLTTAAERGELASAEQAAVQVRRILDDPKIEKPRLLGFFQAYFGYDEATSVFKDRPKDLMYEPQQYVADTDQLVRHVLAEDRDVLRQLLTTPKSFVNISFAENKETRRKDVPKRAKVPNAHNNRGQLDVEGMYGLSEWPAEQPATLPADTRLGILMQPSWLIAWSTNFDNDPVRRGRWIRERLLGGTVPDLPIGVAAQVPDDPHRTFRDRLQVTRDAKCWKCHRRMDDLGLPLENFDHYGRYRTAEMVLDPEATAANVDKKGQPLGPVLRPAALDTTGAIADSGDPRLDGPVRDPREMVLRLADSARVRQVFVRHVFRYYLGRNESIADAAALQAADRAYVESGGSFRALITAILSSDSFLYRMRTPTDVTPSGATVKEPAE